MRDKERNTKSNLDIVKECDNFPYYDPNDPKPFNDAISPLWLFFLPDDPNPHGYLLPSTVEKMPWTQNFLLLNTNPPQVHLIHPSLKATVVNRARAFESVIEELLKDARDKKLFANLKGWRNEKYPVLGANFPLAIERAGSNLFGIVTRGAHMTVYTRTAKGALKFWIPRRAASRSTFPGMLDNTVAGGVAYGEMPFECIVREAAEEASLPEDLVRRNTKSVGAITWFNIKDSKSGGEVGLLQPGIQYVYDLEIPEDVVPKPMDGESEDFRLLDVEEVRKAMGEEQFRPSCAMVIMDFMVRHAIVTAENEKDYVEICARLKRKLPFRTTPSGKYSRTG